MKLKSGLIKPLAFLIGFATTPISPNLLADDDEFVSSLIDKIAALDERILKNPDSADAYQSRGVAYFELGKFERAISDFDRVIAIVPGQEPYHWQRGICYYYAGEYEKGIRQFERHQTVNSNDVENAVWHFLCKARFEGTETARKSLIPIEYDSRVPMDMIWKLFSGQGNPAEVLEVSTSPERDSLRYRQKNCYAHLYLGLYYEVHGLPDLARKHIDLAATQYSMNNYMGMVAKVHSRLLKRQIDER